MGFGDDLVAAVAFGADAVHRRALAEEAGPRRQAEGAAAARAASVPVTLSFTVAGSPLA